MNIRATQTQGFQPDPDLFKLRLSLT